MRCLIECRSQIGCLVDVKFHDNWPIIKGVKACQDLFVTFGNIWSNLLACLIFSEILNRKMYIPTIFHRNWPKNKGVKLSQNLVKYTKFGNIW